MNQIFPDAPANGAQVSPVADLSPVREFLARRRSANKQCLAAPGPNEAQLQEILRVAARVPDHRKLEPWRFIIVQGAARERLGEVFARRWLMLNPDADEAALEVERGRALRAPVSVYLVSAPVDDGRTDVWEQQLSVGAAGHQLGLAAQAAGFGCVWLTEWVCYDAGVAQALGLADGQRLAGQFLIGTPTSLTPERPRPDMARIVSHWAG